jgi:hypothetical protein
MKCYACGSEVKWVEQEIEVPIPGTLVQGCVMHPITGKELWMTLAVTDSEGNGLDLCEGCTVSIIKDASVDLGKLVVTEGQEETETMDEPTKSWDH